MKSIPSGLMGMDAPMLQLPGSNSPVGFMNDSAQAGGLAFLVGELEKRDPKLLEPLTSTTWPRDIIAKTGGGWLEFTSSYNVSYASVGSNEGGIIGGQTTEIPTVQADIGKDLWRLFVWANKLAVPLVDQKKLQTMGRSLDELLDKGLHLNWDKTLDSNTYLGFPAIGTVGLVNNPDVLASMVAPGASGTTEWASKNPDEILEDVNQLINDTWEDSEYDLTGMANHILMPPEKYTLLVTRRIGDAGSKSILTYLLENNIGRNQGIDLVIFPSRWCIGQGENGTDRMVGYANNADTVQFDMTVPLTRVITQPSAEKMAYISTYAGQFSQVKFKRMQPIKYRDGI